MHVPLCSVLRGSWYIFACNLVNIGFSASGITAHHDTYVNKAPLLQIKHTTHKRGFVIGQESGVFPLSGVGLWNNHRENSHMTFTSQVILKKFSLIGKLKCNTNCGQ